MFPKPLQTFSLALALAALATGCGRSKKTPFEGRWVGAAIDNIPPGQSERATGWVRQTSFDFHEDKVTVTIPAEKPRTGRFAIRSKRGKTFKTEITSLEGVTDSAKFALADDKLIWDIGEGRHITFRRSALQLFGPAADPLNPGGLTPCPALGYLFGWGVGTISEAISDKQLVANMAEGDEQAFATLYDRYSGLCFGLLVQMLRSQSEAEDALHDVMLEVRRQAKSYDPARGSVRTWLLVRFRSRALDRLKSASRRRHVFTEPAEFDQRAAAATTNEDARQLVAKALHCLNEEQAEILRLSYFEGLTLQEIAEKQGLPLGTIKSRLARALSRMRKFLSSDGEIP